MRVSVLSLFFLQKYTQKIKVKKTNNNFLLSRSDIHTSRDTMITTKLPNGLRVATDGGCFRPHCCLGVFFPLGSKYEVENSLDIPVGITRYFELAFRQYKDRRRMEQRLAKGPVMTSEISATKEWLSFSVETLRPNAEAAFGTLMDELHVPGRRGSKGFWKYKAPDLLCESDQMAIPETAVVELMHQTAYGGPQTPLGRRTPYATSPSTLRKLTQRHLDAFLSKHVYGADPSEMVVVGAGLNHSDLIKLVSKYKISKIQPKRTSIKPKIKQPYVGGSVVRTLESAAPALVGPTAHLSHVGVCFKAPSAQENMYPTLVAASVLGGGSAFSAGGPGKGMHTRYFTSTLSEMWAETAMAYTFAASHCGLAGAVGSADPRRTKDLLYSLLDQLILLGLSPVKEAELERAKNMLKTDVRISLDRMPVLCEDIGSQLLLKGSRDDANEFCRKVDMVTPELVRKAVRDSLLTTPTVAVICPESERHNLVSNARLHSMIKALVALSKK